MLYMYIYITWNRYLYISESLPRHESPHRLLLVRCWMVRRQQQMLAILLGDHFRRIRRYVTTHRRRGIGQYIQQEERQDW